MSAISRLSQTTTQLLGSSLVIITPVTLVKELVDNSIDAKATSIEILISADTVKKIAVRDNGVGIHPDDYDALGRRSHTSKLRSYDDLKIQSGKTLGFRGEALASVNSFAKVTITTKITSEPVAAILHILPDTGGVSKQQRTSAPVGTTVSVTDLLGRLPVREQMAIKNSAKTIDMIRELLRSYAMARPQVRLSFKVLQSPKQGWSYSPKPSAGVREAAIQLFGTEFASQCVEKTFETGGPVSEDISSKKHQDLLLDEGYAFEAFIPKPGSDPSKIPKHRYFSVDGRPITARRGTMKKLFSIYSEHLGIAFRPSSSTATLRDSFIRLNIKCPPGSYDVNIEPSKDEILFSDEQAILDGFKELCEETYGAPVKSPGFQLEPEANSPIENEDDRGAQDPRSPELQAEPGTIGVGSNSPSRQIQSQVIAEPELPSQSQDQRAPAVHHAQPGRLQEISRDTSNPSSTAFVPINAPVLSPRDNQVSAGSTDPEDGSSNIRRSQWNVDMSTDYNERCYDNRMKRRPPIPVPLGHQEELGVVEFSIPQDANPWIIAKMNAPKGRRVARESEGSDRLALEPPPMSPDPPILRHTGAAPRDLDVPASQRHLESQGNSHQLRPRLPGGPYRSPMSSPQETMISSPMPSTLKPRARRQYPPWSPPSSAPRTAIYNEHLGDSNQPASDSMKQTTISFGGTAGGHRKRRIENDGENSQHEYPGKEQENDPRQVPARRNLRRRLSQQKGPCQQQSPNHSHVPPEIPRGQLNTHPRAAQDQIEGCSTSKIKEPIQTSLPTDDPRAYLLRRQKSMATEEKGAGPRKIRRLKSCLLPLEKIPNGDEIHSLAMVEIVNTEALRIYVKHGAFYDKYIGEGVDYNGLEMTAPEGREIEARLKAILRTQKREASNGEARPESTSILS
ncbi:hypothetical protein F4818DRAFT_167015 [Hypoxylon cercidicola]|nr:hypothetical protein F4818DRAFT_167015 [Hypoxylon cercidicola]